MAIDNLKVTPLTLGVTEGNQSLGAGYGKSGGRWGNTGGKHTGQDIEAPEGTSVTAPIDGVVSRVEDRGNKSYGRYVVVKGSDGREYYFAHLSEQQVKVGQKVTAGQQVGLSGSTGNASGPHLHVEVRENGHSVDPVPVLKGRSVVAQAGKPSTEGIKGVDPGNDYSAYLGWNMAVLNSDPDLKRLYAEAVKDTWTRDRFIAELRDTDWYRKRTESQRANSILQTTDPTEYKRRRNGVVGNTRALMGSLGVPLTDAQVNKISQDAFDLGWSEDELRRNIVNSADWNHIIKAPDTNGSAAEIEQDIKKTAASYGVNVSNGFIAKQVDKVLMQQGTRDGYVEYFRNAAKQTYHAYADQIDAGYSVDEIAEPYKQTVAKLLELNPDQVTLEEPLVKKWLTARGDDQKPAFVPMWKAENEARQDARWMKTNNAREAVSGAALKVLGDWGLHG